MEKIKYSLFKGKFPLIFSPWTHRIPTELKGLNLLQARLTPNLELILIANNLESKINFFFFLLKEGILTKIVINNKIWQFTEDQAQKLLRHPAQFLLQPQSPCGSCQGNRTQKGDPSSSGTLSIWAGLTGMEGIKHPGFSPRKTTALTTPQPNTPVKISL